jgi:hypothetical protein
MYTTTMAVAHSLSTLESACKKECVFFKDRVRRKEKECERLWEKEYGSREHENKGNDEYSSSQVVTINDQVITNGITFIVDGGSSSINSNRFRAHEIIQETERILLERYAQTFLTGAQIAPKFTFQIPSLPLLSTITNGNNGVLTITGVWESESEFGLEYRWLPLVDSVKSDVSKLHAGLSVGGKTCEQ